MITEVEHPIIGPMKMIAPPTKFSNMDYSVRRPAPWIGQHTSEVLHEAGLSHEDIERLYEAGVAFDAHPELRESTAVTSQQGS